MMSRQARRKLEADLAEAGRRDPRRYLLEATAWTVLGQLSGRALWLLFLSFMVWGRGGGFLVLAGTILGIEVLMGLLVFLSERFAGTRLKRADAPRLYAELDAIRVKLKAPRIHAILLDDSFNASLSEARGTFLPVFGRFITVGLPLLDGLSRDQFRAILAHEVGHASRAQGWTAAHACALYARLSERLIELKAGAGWSLGQGMMEWYLPRLRARTFVLLRMKEAQADLESLEAVGPALAAEGLALLAVRGRQFQRDAIADLRRRRSTAPGAAGLFETLAEIVRAGNPRDAEEYRSLLAQPQDDDDTHPPLVERIRSFGVDPEAVALNPPRPGEAASDYFLSDPAAIRARLDALWKPHAGATVWADDAGALASARERVAVLRERRAAGAASDEDVLDLARCLRRVGSGAEALAAYREAAALAPAGLEAAAELGLFLAASGDASGLEWLARGASGPLPVAERCVSALVAWHEGHGSAEEARVWRRRRDELLDEFEGARVGAVCLRESDRFEAVRVDPFLIDAARARLEGNASIRRVWLVGKGMGAAGEWRLPAFVVEPQPLAALFSTRAYQTALAGLATLAGSEERVMGLFTPEDCSPGALEAIEKIPGALIIDRSRAGGAHDWAVRISRWAYVAAALSLIPLMHWDQWRDGSATGRLWLLAFDAFVVLAACLALEGRRRNWAVKGIAALAFLLTLLAAVFLWPWGLALLAVAGLPALSFAAGWWRPHPFLET